MLGLAPEKRTEKAIISALNKLATDADCVGDYISRQYQSRYISRIDPPTGNYMLKFKQANSSGCMERSATIPRDVCESCNGNSCFVISRQASCMLLKNSTSGYDAKLACKEFNGKWVSEGNCFFEGMDTEKSCFTRQNPNHIPIKLITGEAHGTVISEGYCYQPDIKSKSSCLAIGKWNDESKMCIIKLPGSKCQNSSRYRYVPAFVFRKSRFDTKDSCRGKVCSILPFATKLYGIKCSERISERDSYCDDFEYYNVQEGLCTRYPTAQDPRCSTTLDGRCITALKSRRHCQHSNFTWIPRARTKEECESKGTFCIANGGIRTLLSSEDCYLCGGSINSAYRWFEQAGQRGKLRKLSWSSSKFNNAMIKSSITPAHFRSLLQIIEARVQAKILLNLNQPYINKILSVFRRIACDCQESSDGCFQHQVFATLGSCRIGRQWDCLNFGITTNLTAEAPSNETFKEKHSVVHAVTYNVVNFIGLNN